VSSATTCPLCGGSAYGWLTIPARELKPSVGMPSPIDPDEVTGKERIVDRCADCDSGIARGKGKIDLAAELEAISTKRDDGSLLIAAPNRASLQAGIGSEGWAALADWRTRLLLTPKGLELLARKQGYELDRVRFQIWGQSQVWMWQTLTNGLTLHPNFLREVRAGRLTPENARSRFAYVADFIASVLAAPLVALVSFPLELIGIVLRKGGLIVAEARRA